MRRLQVTHSPALAAAVESADFVERMADDSGPRIAVLCPALGSAFIFNREDAERRIRRRFPEVDDEGINRAVHHLESRIRIYLKPARNERAVRDSWARGWANDRITLHEN